MIRMQIQVFGSDLPPLLRMLQRNDIDAHLASNSLIIDPNFVQRNPVDPLFKEYVIPEHLLRGYEYKLVVNVSEIGKMTGNTGWAQTVSAINGRKVRAYKLPKNNDLVRAFFSMTEPFYTANIDHENGVFRASLYEHEIRRDENIAWIESTRRWTGDGMAMVPDEFVEYREVIDAAVMLSQKKESTSPFFAES